MRQPDHRTRRLFSEPKVIMPGLWFLPEFADQNALGPSLADVVQQAPVRHMKTQRGFLMGVAMSNCGQYGWISDQKGYRYAEHDPDTGDTWPAMPDAFTRLATTAAAACGFEDFSPDVCLINRYAVGKGMGAHQDRDESDITQPIVSVSLGLPARFFMLGPERRGPSTPVDVSDGDVVVFGGPARLHYHGVRAVKPGIHPVHGAFRWNLTFRQARASTVGRA